MVSDPDGLRVGRDPTRLGRWAPARRNGDAGVSVTEWGARTDGVGRDGVARREVGEREA